MDLATIIIIGLRIIVPVSILRYPLGGFAASLLLDAFHAPFVDIVGGKDVFAEVFAFDDFKNYHLIDKWLDVYYLFFAFLASLKWQSPLIKKTSIFLFSLRSIGVVLFSVTGFRYFLFFFPNIFEFFYLYCAIAKKWFKKFLPDSLRKLSIVLLVLGMPKLIHEYFFHVEKLRAGEIVNLLTPFKISAPTLWQWFKGFLPL